MDIEVFEAKALDAGIVFLVLVAAQAALEGLNRRQVLLVLRRLQDELMQSYFVVSDPRRWNHAIPPRSGQKFSVSLLGSAQNVVWHRPAGEMVLEAGENAFNPHLLQRVDTYSRSGAPYNVWIRPRGCDTDVQQLQAFLATRHGPQQSVVEAGGLGTTRFMENRFADVVLHSSLPELERIKDTLRRWEPYMAEGGIVDSTD